MLYWFCKECCTNQWLHNVWSFLLHPSVNTEHKAEQAAQTIFQVFCSTRLGFEPNPAYQFLWHMLYPRGSKPFSYHLPFQHSDKWACTPTAFQQIRMYPFKILTDEHIPLKLLMTKYFLWFFINRFNNMHIMTFENNIKWYMHKDLKINNMQIYFCLLLLTLNVPLWIGKCTPRGTCIPGWEPVLYPMRLQYSIVNCTMQHLHKKWGIKGYINNEIE